MTLQSPGAEVPEIAALGPWFHNLHLPGGAQTAPDHPLGDFPAAKWQHLAPLLPERLDGWSVLDIGCNAGFYSFELAARGAAVVGIDADEHYLRQARWAAEQLDTGDRVELRQQQVYDLARTDETWDLVLFMGVLYHLRHPLLALDLVARRTRRLLVLQTLTMPDAPVPETCFDVPFDRRELLAAPGWPKLSFVEHRLANDPTNWWVANAEGIEAMARSAGLELVGRAGVDILLCRPQGLPLHVEAELDAVLGR
ncbi:MAG TPA: TIGR04290 family methyltransferase [Gaiellaceae bacterium]|nr:TIGR04290 family methyltransferase [Gaiellaceae bacterium]